MHPPSRRPAPAMMILTQTRAMICRPTTPLVGGPADIHPPLRDVHPPLRPPPPPPPLISVSSTFENPYMQRRFGTTRPT